MLREEFANEVYQKMLRKSFHMKGEYCNDKISELSLSISLGNYKKTCNISEAFTTSFVEGRTPEIINNIYKITNNVISPTEPPVNPVQGINISVSTSSGQPPLTIGQKTYQNNKLKGQNPPVIFVNNIPEFAISEQFEINPTDGILTRTQEWGSGDTLVII